MEASTYSDQTIHAVHQLAYTCLEDLTHTNQVTRLSLMLFDELGSLHQLGRVERFWLECGAMLHDIGWIHGQKGHHKKSMQMILDSQMLPFDNKEKLIVASIARYHRKSLPSLQHDHYAVLQPEEREIVSKLAAMLRIADGLDYSHTNVVSHIQCHITARRVVFNCWVSHSAKIELRQAERKADLFNEIYARRVFFTETLI